MMHLAHAEDARDTGGMRRAGAAEPDHRVGARILALLDQMDARRRRHALGDDLVDAPGGLDRRQAEPLADARRPPSSRGLRSSAMRPPRKKPGS